MPYVKKTIPELSNIIKQQISSELGIDVALIDDASMINIFAKVIAATQTEQYADIEFFTKQAFPTLATEDGIREWGLVKEIEWITSRVSAGTTDITGTNGSVVIVGTELTNSNGDVFISTVEVTIAGGVGELPVESQEGGEDKNMDSGEILSFVSTPTGVDTLTTVTTDGLTGGTDTWTLEQYKEAVLRSFSAPARGGSVDDYEAWTKEVLDASNVWVFGYSTHPASITKGDVEVYFIMDAYTDGIPPVGDRDRVVAYIDTLRPVGMGTFLCPALIAEPIYYDITLTPNADAEVEAAVEASLVAMHESTEPGGSITTGQMNRAISDAVGVVDFVLNKVDTIYPPVAAPATQTATDRFNLLTVSTMTWS